MYNCITWHDMKFILKRSIIFSYWIYQFFNSVYCLTFVIIVLLIFIHSSTFFLPKLYLYFEICLSNILCYFLSAI